MSGSYKQRARPVRLDSSEISQERHHDSDQQLSWSQEEAKRFFEAFQMLGSDWMKVAGVVHSKSPDACEALHRKFRSFLSLPKPLLNVAAFLAVVKDSLKVESSDAETVSNNPIRGSSSSIVNLSDEFAEGEVEKESEKQTKLRQPHAKSSRRSVRVPKTRQGEQIADNPTWTVKRPRARRESLHHSDASARPSKKNQEFMDAEGVDALLSLANVGLLSSAEMLDHNEDSAEDGGRNPLKDPKKLPKAVIEDDYDIDASQQASVKNGRSSKGRRRTEGKPTRHLLSPKRNTAKSLHGNKSVAEESHSAAGKTADLSKISESNEHPIRQSSRARRTRDFDEDFVVKSDTKKRRKRKQPDADTYSEDAYEANLEAEQENLDEESIAHEELENSRPRREPIPRRKRRKVGSEKPPPMMARAKAIFARRNILTLNCPPPAFLIGLPPFSAQASGIETEGQSSMGETETRLRNCLEPRVRRWCSSEFFCSVIDRPWLMRNELVDYLGHVGITKGTKLSRPELAIIRASLGKPRRLSLNYLRQERIKLEAWREEVRAKYAEIGPGSELPAEYPPQLQVGQKVVARHPVTRHLHDGDVLTVTPNSYRVQFERRELGVELVRDIDVMPVDPTDCLPQSIVDTAPQIVLNGRSAQKRGGQHASPLQGPERVAMNHTMTPQTHIGCAAMQSSTAIRSLADMRAALETKDLLLARLQKMNDEIEAGMHKQEGGQRPAAFQKAYAQVLVDLQMMNKTLENCPYSQQVSVPQVQPLTAPVVVTTAATSPRPEPVLLSPGVMPVQVDPHGYWAPACHDPVKWQSMWTKAKQLVQQVRNGQIHSEVGDEAQQSQQGTCHSPKVDAGDEALADRETDVPIDDADSQLANQSKSGDEDDLAQFPGEQMVRGCIGLMLVLVQSSRETQKFSDVTHAIGEGLHILQPQAKSSMPYFKEITESIAMLKSKFSLHI